MNIPAEATGAPRGTWGATVGVTIALQWAVVLILVVVAWVLGGRVAGTSLLGGGAAVAVPNALLALWLTARMRRPGGAGAVAMLFGELVKLAATIALLVGLVRALQPELSWPALIVGVVGALKAQWLALWFTRKF